MKSQTQEMDATPDLNALLKEIEDLKKRLKEVESQKQELQKKIESLPSQGVAVKDTGDEIAPISELDSTLRRLVQRIAMILQAEKVLMMFFDREKGELLAISPAYGIDEDLLSMVRVRATQGISGEVFREGKPAIFHDAVTDPRTEADPFAILHVNNGLCVPLVIERRDEENRVIDRTTIGVLYAFNKRHNEDFNDEDVRLLERMAKNAASIISNLKLYQEIVEEKQELLQTIESLYAGLILTNSEGRITQMNASARAIFGLNPADALGRGYTDIIKDARVCEQIKNSIEGVETSQVEAAISLDGRGERVYEVQSAIVKNEDGRIIGAVTILNDATDRKNIERMKSAFVATVSHELRTPLTAIKGFTSTLIADDFSEDDRKEFYTIIDHECDRLTRLINDLLNIARIEAGESLKPDYGHVDVLGLAKKVLLIQKQSTHKHELVLDAKGDIPNIIADQDKLDQILTNLISNAIKYSPDGGQVTLHIEAKDKEIEICVEDQGIGIPPEHVGKVFDRFHRVHTEDNRRIYGTGLGLFLVKHLVEQIHKGRVWVESEVGVGSKFFVRLPIELEIESEDSIRTSVSS
jgi:PAS domain S-box-containing protein